MTSERERLELDAAIRRVVERNACIGCGLCTRLDTSLELELDTDGSSGRTAPASRESSPPARRAASSRPAPDAAWTPFARREPRHPTMGSSFGVWEAWATDEAVRHRGSSGGALTALHGWLLERGRASTIASASVGSDPRRTVPVTITTKAEALAAAVRAMRRSASSRIPTSATSDAITAKPCEIAAIRALGDIRTHARRPRRHAGNRSSSRSSAPARRRRTRPTNSSRGSASDPASPSPISGTAVGDGPADSPFAMRDGDTSMSYEESWGGVLGPSTHWRCKVCAGGVGESADVVAADFWRVDERGYPVFTEGAGSSALIARTERGLEAVLAAAAAGAIVVRPIRMSELANVQPLQRNRRTSLFGRLLGSRFAGVRGPRYRGSVCGLWRWRTPVSTFARRAAPTRGFAAPTRPRDPRRDGPTGRSAGAEADATVALVVVNFASSALLAANLVDPRLRAVVDTWSSSTIRARSGRPPASASCAHERVEPCRTPVECGLRRGDQRRCRPRAGTPLHARARTQSRCDDRHRLGPGPPRREQGRPARTHRATRHPERRDALVLGGSAGPRTGTTRRAREVELAGDRTWQTGACFMATIAMWDEVGGFDDDYFMYWEDIDLSWRWREAGGTLIVRPEATAVHDAGGTQSGAASRRCMCTTTAGIGCCSPASDSRRSTGDGGGREASPTRGTSPRGQSADAREAPAAALVGVAGHPGRRVRPFRGASYESARLGA